MQKLIPTLSGEARTALTQVVLKAKATTTTGAIDYLLGRLPRVPVSPDTRDTLIAFLEEELSVTKPQPRRNLYERPTAHDDPLHHGHPGISNRIVRTSDRLDRAVSNSKN